MTLSMMMSGMMRTLRRQGSSPKMGGKQARIGDYCDEQPTLKTISVCTNVKHLPFFMRQALCQEAVFEFEPTSIFIFTLP
jgi:hypothetical protein